MLIAGSPSCTPRNTGIHFPGQRKSGAAVEGRSAARIVKQSIPARAADHGLSLLQGLRIGRLAFL